MAADAESLQGRIIQLRANLCEFAQTPLEEASLGLLAGERERASVGGARLVRAAEPAAEIGPRRVRQVVVGELAAREDRVDQREPRLRPVAHRDRHRAVQLDDRRRSARSSTS